MQSQSNISKARVIISGIVLIFAVVIGLIVLPNGQPLSGSDVMHLAIPALVAGIFFLFYPQIAQLSQRLTNLFIQVVAREISQQIQTFSSSLPHPRRRRDSKRIKYVNPMVLDTSAIIDGRIEYMLSTGFVFGTFLVPQFVLIELQNVADSASAMKRQRGRRGLEVLEVIKSLAKTDSSFSVAVISDDPKRLKATDEKLLKVAKRYKAAIVTCDYNLNKVANVSGIRVLNVNELVNAIKTVTLPGETIWVKVVQRGKEKDQGVGYLEDGTMVVIEDGQVYVGSEIKITVSRVLQTSAGRMIFGSVEPEYRASAEMPKTTN